MTVAELIARLQQMSQDSVVLVEGEELDWTDRIVAYDGGKGYVHIAPEH